MEQSNLEAVDWTRIVPPDDDGAANHFVDMIMPRVILPSTNEEMVDVGALKGLSVIFFYPMMGRPGTPLPDGWDEIPGARGCTPQSCAFRDHYNEFINHGVHSVYGISTQDVADQKEASDRLHLPYSILSDNKLRLANSLKLPTFSISDMTLIKRITLVLRDGEVDKVFYPIFPPDKNAENVIKYLKSMRHLSGES